MEEEGGASNDAPGIQQLGDSDHARLRDLKSHGPDETESDNTVEDAEVNLQTFMESFDRRAQRFAEEVIKNNRLKLESGVKSIRLVWETH